MGTDGMGAREAYREVVLENIGYEYLIQDSHIDREQLDEIAELIVDTVCSARKTIRVAGDDYPAEVVKSRFMKLDSSHVQYVILPIGYHNVNLFLLDWESGDYGNLCFNDLLDYLYRVKTNDFFMPEIILYVLRPIHIELFLRNFLRILSFRILIFQ